MLSFKRLKLIDISVQLGAVLLPLCYILLNRHTSTGLAIRHIMIVYFVLGVVQVFSTLTHRLMYGNKNRISGKGWYEGIILLLVGVGLFSAYIDFYFFMFYLLLYTAPFLGVWYMGITLCEYVLAHILVTSK